MKNKIFLLSVCFYSVCWGSEEKKLDSVNLGLYPLYQKCTKTTIITKLITANISKEEVAKPTEVSFSAQIMATLISRKDVEENQEKYIFCVLSKKDVQKLEQEFTWNKNDCVPILTFNQNPEEDTPSQPNGNSSFSPKQIESSSAVITSSNSGKENNIPKLNPCSAIPIFGAGFCAGAASSLFIFALLYATNSYQNNNYYHAHSSWNLFDFLRFR